MKQTKHQQEAADSKAPIVVLRWARRTGKNMLIEHLMNKETDFVIEPTGMAAVTAEAWEGWSVFQEGVIKKELLHYIKRRQVKGHRTKRIFMNECAFFESKSLLKLIPLLQKEWPKAQIYLISTPRGGWKLNERGSAGFEFDLLCARLHMTYVHDWYYSQVETPEDKITAASINLLTPPQFVAEYKAGWWDIT